MVPACEDLGRTPTAQRASGLTPSGPGLLEHPSEFGEIIQAQVTVIPMKHGDPRPGRPPRRKGDTRPAPKAAKTGQPA